MIRTVFLVIYLAAAAIAVLLFNADTANGEWRLRSWASLLCCWGGGPVAPLLLCSLF